MFISSDPSIVELYLEYGDKFSKYLDNTFLFIVKHDFYIDLFTDPWGANQVNYFEDNNNFYFTNCVPWIGSGEWNNYIVEMLSDECKLYCYYSIPQNSHCRFDIRDRSFKVINNKLHVWNFGGSIDSMELVEEAFNNAVLENWESNGTVSLSSGVDSCAIAVCLADNNIEFNALCALFNPEFEDESVLESIINYCGKYINYQEIKNITIDHKDKSRALAEIYYRTKNVFKSDRVLTGQHSANRDKTWADMSTIENSAVSLQGGQFGVMGVQKSMVDWNKSTIPNNIRILNWWEKYAIDDGIEVRHVYCNKKLVQAWHDLNDRFKIGSKKPFLRKYVTDRNLPHTSGPLTGGFGNQSRSKYGFTKNMAYRNKVENEKV